MCSELLIMSEINWCLWSSVCEYQSVECAFTSPVSIESGMLLTCRFVSCIVMMSVYIFFWCRLCWFEVWRCLCHLVDCWLWLGGWWFDGHGLLCWMHLALLLQVVCVYEWCIFNRVCIVVVSSVCISDEPSVCCVCGYIWLRCVVCLFVCDQSKWLEWVQVCVCLLCRRTRIWLEVPRFCEEQSQPGGWEWR